MPSLIGTDLQTAVQKNCHISDARHAGDYTLCIYLLKMREYFRWENGYKFNDTLPQDKVGNWLKEREQLWNGLEKENFTQVPINGDFFDPFDTDAINQTLIPQGLVYSGGFGQKFKPHFFLGKLQRQELHGDYTVLICADEYARDLTSPPAMTLGQSVFIRRESIRRMIWERVEEWRWNRLDNAMGRAIACYDFDADLDRALEQMTDKELETVLDHEIGEVLAGQHLGPEWEELLSTLPRSKAEIIARAVRDHLADALSTLPRLLERADNAALHSYVANLNGMRKELCPSLKRAYTHWVKTGDQDNLRSCAADGRTHWLSVAEAMLQLHRKYGARITPYLEELVEESRL
ncbi:MAG: Sfum_1244 family protein [Gammaproteobacteria bacterium]